VATSTIQQPVALPSPVVRSVPGAGLFIMAILLIAFGFWVIYPIILIFVTSFNTAGLGQPPVWSLENWRTAWSHPGAFPSLWNTLLVYALYTSIGFPIAVAVAWALARTKMPFSNALEFMFWVSFMLPNISTTVGWAFLLDPDRGMLNRALVDVFSFLHVSPFNIYSVSGIVFTHLMSNQISQGVMLLTPAIRNMDMALEEAARVSGASNLRTMLRVTLPLMTPPIVVVFMLKMARMLQSFEIEQILGTPINFFIYSTRIYQFIQFEPPQYGPAAALASVTLLLVGIIIPLQRWLLGRRQFTTVSGQFKPGVIDLRWMQPIAFILIVILVAMLTVVPIATLIGGSFMTRVGFFQVTPLFTTQHWQLVLSDRGFIRALITTLTLASATAIVSPLLFSVVAYVMVRTKWPGRGWLDSIFWLSAAIPGILASFGLLSMFLQTPFLRAIYGTVYALALVTILQGKLTSTQLVKGVFMQLGSDLEEAARVSGAGWLYTYVRIWLPLILPTLVTIGTFNFVIAANTTSSIILLATRDTLTLSLLALEMMTNEQGRQLEQAGIISLVLILMTVGLALVARGFGFRVGIRQHL
jgi:iron(III) transport system permease protein